MLAKANSDYNARAFISADKRYSQYSTMNHGDSTISKTCPTGDGWSTVDLRDDNGKKVAVLKCSTASFATSCLEKSLFKTKSYAQQDGHCNEELPESLPKLKNS